MAIVSDLPNVLRVGDLDVAVSISDRRKNIRLTVERDASVSVIVPPAISARELAKLVEVKRPWLYRKLAEKREYDWRSSEKEFVSGEGFSYLGRSYRLRIVPGGEVRLSRGRLELPEGGGADDLVAWYCRVGLPWLTRRIQPWATRIRVQPAGVRVRPLGYRWGSCSTDGNVNVHWATMQLPPSLVDYVLVHELVHLRHADHGTEFWRTIERALPGYQADRERLRRAGTDLWLPTPPK
jgi:predicted metal-dependent hydrolase